MSSEGAVNLDRETEIEIDRAATIIFERLYRLVQKGYRPDFEMEFTESIWLRHPGKYYLHKTLILYPCGMVVSLGAQSDDFRFYRDDREQFQHFLERVPRPTLLDRTRDARGKVMGWLLLVALACTGAWIGHLLD